MLDVIIKDKVLRIIGVYAHNEHVDRPDLLRRIDAFLTTSDWVVLAGDRKAVLDSDIDLIGARLVTNNRDVKRFRNFVDKFNHVSKYRNEHPHPREVVWTWTNRVG